MVVTGAGRGIGKRLAIGFAAKGARVGLVARSKAELDLCHLEIEHGGGAALRMRADVCDYEQITVALERMRVQFGSSAQRGTNRPKENLRLRSDRSSPSSGRRATTRGTGSERAGR